MIFHTQHRKSLLAQLKAVSWTDIFACIQIVCCGFYCGICCGVYCGVYCRACCWTCCGTCCGAVLLLMYNGFFFYSFSFYNLFFYFKLLPPASLILFLLSPTADALLPACLSAGLYRVTLYMGPVAAAASHSLLVLERRLTALPGFRCFVHRLWPNLGIVS